MPKPGPKPKPQNVIALRGTEQACRKRAPAVPLIDREIVKPKWLTGAAAKIWAEKLAIYEKRGQDIAGCEMALAQYCAAEATMIDLYRKKLQPPVALIREHRMMAAEFYDTPASQAGRPGSGADSKGNPFANNGRRPQS